MSSLQKENGYLPLSSWLLCWFVLLIAVKLILSSEEEMFGVFLPHDDLWQVWAAKRWYWGGGYGANYLYRLPLYPLFIKLVSLTGFPLRIVLELFYSLSSVFLCATLRKVGVPSVIAGVLALVTIFQPYSFQLLSRFQPEVFLAPLIMLALAYSIRWWFLRKTENALKPALLAALFWALAWNTRAEALALLPIFFVLGVGVLIIDCSASLGIRWRRIFLGLILPLAACIGVNLTICSINYLRWGLFADSILTAPGYLAAYKALQAIRPSQPIPYVPISYEARKAACSVSPTFALVETQLESERSQGWNKMSKAWTDSMGIHPVDPSEICAGLFFWALYDAAASGGYADKPKKGDLFLQQIAKEINTAFKQGQLSKRFVLFTMVDPNTLGWLQRYPKGLKNVYHTFISFSQPITPFADQKELSEEVKKEIDILANRRASRFINPSYYNQAQFWKWGWSWKIERVWSTIYYALVFPLQWIALLGILFCFFKKENVDLKITLLLFLVVVATRILLFSLFDATTCNGDQPRYLFAVMPEFSMLLVLGGWLFFKEAWFFLRLKAKNF